ncbi:MAG: hypothetical protein HC821_04915 [Lewinella sp.]|nr:hypothetical protein [Lewinella sp.]
MFVLLLLLAGFSAPLCAQSSSSYQPTYRMELGFQLRDLMMVLELSNAQMAVLKDYYAETDDLIRSESAIASTTGQRMQILRNYQQLRDNKVRSLLEPAKMSVFENFLLARTQGQIIPSQGGEAIELGEN